jgi:anionic cell wall polymer biosynthesis LytR-Cps2A-Psr (LCP) family protein
VSAILGNITVDGSWILQPAQLTKLIDLVGGITVDVDVDVVQRTAGGGGNVLVPAGANRKLTGAQAVQYATYSTSATSDAANQLARLQQVIDATAAALPRTTTAVTALLRQLGAGGSSTLGVTPLADFLVGFGTAERATGALLPTDLPVTPVDAGGSPSYRVDTTRANTLVANSLAKSLPPGANDAHPTVELLNGVGSPGLVATACPRLAAHGLTYAGSRNAPSFNNPRSTIEVSGSNIDVGYQVADALLLPRSDVRRSTVQQSVADAIVTLGGDYRP